MAELIAIAGEHKVIVDTNTPLDVLKEIADDRDDPEKRFLLNVIESCDDPEAVMANYRRGLARINSPERYHGYATSGFFTVVRQDDGIDTREAVCDAIARHFGLLEAEDAHGSK